MSLSMAANVYRLSISTFQKKKGLMDDQIYTTSTEVENLESTLVNCTIAQVTGMTAKLRHGIAYSFTWKSSCKTLFAK